MDALDISYEETFLLAKSDKMTKAPKKSKAPKKAKKCKKPKGSKKVEGTVNFSGPSGITIDEVNDSLQERFCPENGTMTERRKLEDAQISNFGIVGSEVNELTSSCEFILCFLMKLFILPL